VKPFESFWYRISGSLKQISVSSSGRIWGVSSTDEIYTRAGVNGIWKKIDGYLTQISVSSNG
jgi:hypothetical protein